MASWVFPMPPSPLVRSHPDAASCIQITKLVGFYPELDPELTNFKGLLAREAAEA